MQMMTPIGVVLAIATILGGIVLKGSGVHALWSAAALVVVFVGTGSAILVQTPAQTLKRAIRMLPWVVTPPKSDAPGLIKTVVGWSDLARRQGLLGLEPQLDKERDAFVKKGLQLLVDGSEPDTIRGILGAEMDGRRHADLIAAKVFEAAGTYAPTMGIIGAVMGLMAVMEHLSEPGKLGPGIAGAFVSTVYGIASANLLLLPLANKLKGLVNEHARTHEMLIEGMVAIAEGENPRHIEAKLQGFCH
jgi:chemotaxis protein MotA